MTEKRLYDVINQAEPRGQSVTYKGIPCTARTCVTRLNRLTEENEQLKKENQRLEKQKNVLIDYMDNWCPKRFYDGIIKRMEEVE